MKISNKILWGAIGGLFGCVVALLIFVRVSTAPLMEKIELQPHLTGSMELIDRSYPLKYFSGIQASGKRYSGLLSDRQRIRVNRC